jgi:membrane protease YdiL (CAAX protease family)
VLFVAIVLAAPVFEELVIRGFLIGGLEASGVSAVVAAVSSALAWSALHLQYDLYGIATIVPMGLLLALARHRTRSLLPCIAMHGLGNVVAFVEVVVASR